jgi:NhaA family Na+:H+ antiporter
MAIPLNSEVDHGHSLLHSMERALSPWVAFIVLPIFGFANAGVSLGATGHASLLSPLSLGLILGLFVGKQVGIFASVVVAKKAGVAALPIGANWREIYGVAILCGIGFTMSLFIGLLAFSDAEQEAVTKLAVLAGSLLSALAGTVVLLLGSRARQSPEAAD